MVKPLTRLLSSIAIIFLISGCAAHRRHASTFSPGYNQSEKQKKSSGIAYEKDTRKNSSALSLEEENLKLKIQLETALRQVNIEREKIKKLSKNFDSLKQKSLLTTETYIVKKNDSLWKIAAKKEIYNDPYKWLLLYHANKDLVYSPNLIYPNMVLYVLRTNKTKNSEGDNY